MEQQKSKMHVVILCKVLVMSTCIVLIFNEVPKCFASIENELHQVHFEYPGPAISERDLPICPKHAVCSVLHNRYWMSPIVQRLCRCRVRIECPWSWTDYPDNNTMHLDNRSQLKFCDEVSELHECGQKELALTVTTTETAATTETEATIEEGKKLAVNVSCFCPSSFTWEVSQSVQNGTIDVTQYKCKPIQKCSSLEFCGNIRKDYFSTYYRCSCPIGHMCLNRNNIETNITELLYNGTGYQAYCFP